MSKSTIDLSSPRGEIRRLFLENNIEPVLEMAGMLHGHYCPGLALGVRAVHVAFTRLGISGNTGMEEIMAVSECNSCFIDGIQFASGCTLGNNALVYKDLGKTAATFYRRGGKEAIRVCVKSFDPDNEDGKEKLEADGLFEKAVKRREKLTNEESGRMKILMNKRSFNVLRMPAEKLFTIVSMDVPSFSFAPIHDSQICAVCGEKVMETRISLRNGRPHCLTCAGEEYRMVIGKGIACLGAGQ